MLSSADHGGCLDLRFSDGLLHDHLVADAVLHLLLAPALGDHQVILGDLLSHLTALNLAAPILQDLLLEQRVALSGMQAVSLGLLRGLLLLERHQEVAFVLVGRLESFLLDRGPEEGRATVVMNLHHLLLLHLDLLLLFLVLALLQHKHIRFPRWQESWWLSTYHISDVLILHAGLHSSLEYGLPAKQASALRRACHYGGPRTELCVLLSDAHSRFD